MSSPQENKMWKEFSFEKVPLTCEDEQLRPIAPVSEESPKEKELKKHIKDIVDIYKSSVDAQAENVEAKNVLLSFFTKFNKRNVKKYLQDLIEKGLATSIIKSTTDEILQSINSHQICNIRLCTDLFNFVSVMQTSAQFEYEITTEHLFPLYCILLEGFVHHSQYNFEKVQLQSEELPALMNVVLKLILSVFVKDIAYLKIVSESYSVKLIILSHSVVIHSNIGYDIKTKAGLIITHSLNIIPEKFCDKIINKDCPALDLITDHNPNENFSLDDQNLEVLKDIDTFVIIYTSILSVYSKEKLLQVKIENETLICFLFHKIMDCAKGQTSTPHVIVEISRSLVILAVQMKDVPTYLIKPLFLEGLSYVWNNLEHFVDTVRNYVKLFFEELVALAAFHKDNGFLDLVSALLNDVKQLDNSHPSKIIAIENMAVNMGTFFLLEHFRNLPDDLLHAVSQPPVSYQVCKTYQVILDKAFHENTRIAWINRWVAPVVSLLRACPHCSPVAQDIVTTAFQLYPSLLRKIFPNGYVANTQEAAVLLKCLMYARQKGMDILVDAHENCDAYWRGFIDKEKLCRFMTHQDDGIRSGVLAVVVTSQKSTEFFLNWEFNFLMTYLETNITPNTPHMRMQVLAYFKKVLARFNAGYHCITRNIASFIRKIEVGGSCTVDKGSLHIYQELQRFYKIFIINLTKLLISYLTFDSNYCRRAISLELLVLIQSFLSESDWLGCWTVEDIRNCHSILFDSYESNKKLCVVLLKNLPFHSMGFTNVEFTFKYLQRCVNIAIDIKPAKTLAAPYLFEVCAYSPFFMDIIHFGKSRTEREERDDPILDMVALLTEKLFAQARVEVDYAKPKVATYGLLMSLRHLLQIRNIANKNEPYASLFEHLTKFCLNLKDTLMPIVCNPSPEGYLPDTDEVICETDESARAQMILVYAWRTMKEMVLLLAEIIRQNVKFEASLQMLSDDLVIKVGEMFIKIFIESKHRGVFEQAYVAFCVMCDSFWTSSNPRFNCLPTTWLQEGVQLCVGETRSDKLCHTRRSAGLPFLVMAILSSEPIFDKARIGAVVTKLLAVCDNTEESNIEFRIHCMNVLRNTFRHGRLSDVVACYVGKVAIVAMNGFKSDVWGVRNTSTLLYSTVMTRIFGVQRTNDCENVSIKNRLTVRVFSMRYPELFKYLMEQLSNECRKGDSLLLHPVLMMLSGLYPSPFEEYDPHIQKCFQDLTICVSNPVYRTRELAARASVSFIMANEVPTHLDAIFEKLKVESIKDNECHGLLLQALCISKANNLKEIPLTKYLQNSVHILKYVGHKYSHMTATLYMETILVFLMNYKAYDDLQMMKILLRILLNRKSLSHVQITAMNKFLETRLLLILYIVVCRFEESDLTYPTVTYLLISQLQGSNKYSKRFGLNMLIYLNQIQSDYKHPLYVMEEIQIPKEIMLVFDCFDKTCVRKILTNLHQNLKCFLMQEIKYQRQIMKEDQVLLFLLVNYYPCVIKFLNVIKQDTLTTLLGFCDGGNEDLISAVLCCISTFLLELDYSVLHYGKLVKLLAESASPAATDERRLAVCEFLVKNYILYCNEEPILSDDDLQMVYNIMMVLLEDDNVAVRNAISEFSTLLKVRIVLGCNPRQTFSGQRWPVVSEKARQHLLYLATIRFDKNQGICFLFSWACRHFPDTTNDEAATKMFERGELNLYAENISYTPVCAKILRQYLWTLEHGLNYEDKSIFIEEHTLLVTTTLLDAIERNPTPMMLNRSRNSVICALKSTIKFIEEIQINNNFVNRFKIYLNDTIIGGYLTKHMEHSDLQSVKWIFKHIFDPVLNYQQS